MSHKVNNLSSWTASICAFAALNMEEVSSKVCRCTPSAGNFILKKSGQVGESAHSSGVNRHVRGETSVGIYAVLYII